MARDGSRVLWGGEVLGGAHDPSRLPHPPRWYHTTEDRTADGGERRWSMVLRPAGSCAPPRPGLHITLSAPRDGRVMCTTKAPQDIPRISPLTQFSTLRPRLSLSPLLPCSTSAVNFSVPLSYRTLRICLPAANPGWIPFALLTSLPPLPSLPVCRSS